MKPVSKRTWIATALTAAIVGLSATAIAQNTTPATPAAPTAQTGPEAKAHRHDPERHAQRMERMKARMAEHQAQLKQNLQLTPAQEPAWNAFVTRMQPQPRADQRGNRDAWTNLTTPQRLERMEAMRTQRDQTMAQRHDAIRSFYAQLTPEQQKTFDAQGMGRMQRAGMKGDHGKHGHGHGHGGHRM